MVDRIDHWTVSDLEARARMSDGQFRVEAASSGDGVILDGKMWTTAARQGLLVVGAEVEVHGALDLAETGDAGLSLYLNLGEAREFGAGAQVDHVVESVSLGALATRADSVVRERLREGQRLSTVGVTITDALADGLSEEDAGQLRQLRGEVERRGMIRNVASSSRLMSIGQQLKAPEGHGVLRGLHREALALSFLVEAANLLQEPRCPTAILISRRVTGRLDEVAALLEGEGDPPDFARLAQVAGMSATSLRRHFKARFGETLADYARRKRLERSHGLLEEGGWTIAEIAWRCGYSEVANFTTAFRRHFGVTPGQVSRTSNWPLRTMN